MSTPARREALQMVCGPEGCAPEVLEAAEASALARRFKALADPTRLRLLAMIAAAARDPRTPGQDICVCELNAPLGLSQPTVSHHLRILREAGLVTSERRGTWAHYSVVPGAVEALREELDRL